MREDMFRRIYGSNRRGLRSWTFVILGQSWGERRCSVIMRAEGLLTVPMKVRVGGSFARVFCRRGDTDLYSGNAALGGCCGVHSQGG